MDHTLIISHRALVRRTSLHSRLSEIQLSITPLMGLVVPEAPLDSFSRRMTFEHVEMLPRASPRDRFFYGICRWIERDVAVQFAARLSFALGRLEDKAQAATVLGRLPMPATDDVKAVRTFRSTGRRPREAAFFRKIRLEIPRFQFLEFFFFRF